LATDADSAIADSCTDEAANRVPGANDAVESSQLEHVTIRDHQIATCRTAVALFARGSVTGEENNQTFSSPALTDWTLWVIPIQN
jgi:hypothetical protein